MKQAPESSYQMGEEALAEGGLRLSLIGRLSIENIRAGPCTVSRSGWRRGRLHAWKWTWPGSNTWTAPEGSA